MANKKQKTVDEVKKQLQQNQFSSFKVGDGKEYHTVEEVKQAAINQGLIKPPEPVTPKSNDLSDSPYLTHEEKLYYKQNPVTKVTLPNGQKLGVNNNSGKFDLTNQVAQTYSKTIPEIASKIIAQRQNMIDVEKARTEPSESPLANPFIQTGSESYHKARQLASDVVSDYGEDTTYADAKADITKLQNIRGGAKRRNKDTAVYDKALEMLKDYQFNNRELVDSMTIDEIKQRKHENEKQNYNKEQDLSNYRWLAEYNKGTISNTPENAEKATVLSDYFKKEYGIENVDETNYVDFTHNLNGNRDTRSDIAYFDENGETVTWDKLLRIRSAEQKLKEIQDNESVSEIYNQNLTDKSDISKIDEAIRLVDLSFSDATNTEPIINTPEQQELADYLKEKFNIDISNPENKYDISKALNALRSQVESTFTADQNKLKEVGYDWKELDYFNEYQRDKELYLENKAKDQEYAHKNAIPATFGAIAVSPFKIGDYIANIIDTANATKADETSALGLSNIYDDRFINMAKEYTSTVSGDINKGIKDLTKSDFLAWLGSATYTGLSSSLQSAATIGASVALFGPTAGKYISLGIMGSEAAADGFNQAVMNGSTNGEALLTSIANGVNEAMFESLSFDHLLGMRKALDTSSLKNFFKSLLASRKDIFVQGLIEADEELNTDIANTLADYIINGDHTEYYNNISRYMSQGDSRQTAEYKANQDLWKQVLESTYGGFIGGLTAGGLKTAYNTVRAGSQAATNEIARSEYAKSAGESIQKNQTVESVLEEAEKSTDESVRKLAQKARAAIEKGNTKKTGRAVGKTYVAMQEESTSKARTAEQSIIKDVIRKEYKKNNPAVDIDSKAAGRLVDALYRKYKGMELAPVEKRMVSSTAAVKTLEAVDAQSDIIKSKIETSKKSAAESYAKRLEYITPEDIDLEDTTEPDIEGYKKSADKYTYSNGERVEVEGIAAVGADGVQLKLSNGTTENAKNVDLSSEDDAVIFQSISRLSDKLGVPMTADIANQIYRGYDPDVYKSVTSYMLGVREAFAKGYLNEEMKASDVSLPPAARKIFYEAGQTMAAQSAKIAQKTAESKVTKGQPIRKGKITFKDGVEYHKLDKRRRAGVDAVSAMSEALGFDVVFFKSTKTGKGRFSSAYVDSLGIANNKKQTPNGFWLNGKMYIDVNAGANGEGLIMFTASHELVHMIREGSPEDFKALADFLVKMYSKKGMSVDNLVLREMNRSTNMTYDVAYEEVIARSCESFLRDIHLSEKAEQLYKENPSLANKLKEALQRIIAAIKKAYKKLNPQSYEGQTISKSDIESLEQAYDRFIEGIKRAPYNLQSAESKENKARNQDRDSDYLSAVESGDMETAQRMVDEAAEKAFVDSKIRDESGKLLKVYHGTAENFTVFDKSKGRPDADIQGMFFSPDKEDAGGYAGRYGYIGAYYLNIQNPSDFSTGYKALVSRREENNAGIKAREDLEQMGYDGVNNDGEEYIAFNSEQIKSADPVTYDDDGNVIPLSKRFNAEEKDIRYQDRDFTADLYDEDEELADIAAREFVTHHEDIGQVLKNIADIEISAKKMSSIVSRVIRENLGEIDAETKQTLTVKLMLSLESVNEAEPEQISQDMINAVREAIKDAAISDEHGEENYREFLAAISGTYYLTDEQIADLAEHDMTLADFRRKMFGKMNIITRDKALKEAGHKSARKLSLEGMYDVLSYPEEYLPFTRDQWDEMGYHAPIIIMDVLETLNSRRQSKLSDMYSDEDIDDLAVQLTAQLTGAIVEAKYNSRKNPYVQSVVEEEKEKARKYTEKKIAEERARGRERLKEENPDVSDIIEEQIAKDREYTESKVAEERERGRQQLQEQRAIAVEYLDKLVTRLTKKHEKAMQEQKAERKKALADLKTKERERAKKRESKIKEEYRRQRENARERRQRIELRRSIQARVRNIDKLLTRSDKAKTVKQGMRESVSKFLKVADMLYPETRSVAEMAREGVTGATEKERAVLARYSELLDQRDKAKTQEARDKISATLAEMRRSPILKELIRRERQRYESAVKAQNAVTLKSALDEFAAAYREIEKAKESYIAQTFEQDTLDMIYELRDEVEDDALAKDMTLDQLDTLYKISTRILTSIRNANKTFADNLKATYTETCESVISEVSRISTLKDARNKIADAVAKFGWKSLKPVYAMRIIGSQTLEKIYWNLQQGELVWYKDVSEAKKFKEEIEEKYGYKDFDFKREYTFTARDGSEFTLDLNQIMEIYAASRRSQALQHLLLGGFTFPKGSKASALKVYTGSKAYSLTEETIRDISSKLTEDQKKYVEAMQQYLSETMAEKGNEISMKLFGVRLFEEEIYWNISSSNDYIKTQDTETKGTFKLRNSGFTKSTVRNASNPIVLRGFEENWCNHVNEMSLYHGLTLPIEDMQKVFNYKVMGKENTEYRGVRSIISGAYGNAAASYINTLIEDVNGGIQATERISLDKFISLTKKTAVMGNLSVILQQPSAIFRAMAYIDKRDFLASTSNKFWSYEDKRFSYKSHKKMWEQLKKYAPVAGIKEMGSFDTGTSRGVIDYLMSGRRENLAKRTYRKADDFLSSLPALADEIAWVKLWQAVQHETQRKYGYKLGTEKNLVRSGERFNEVVNLTQVYDSVFSRSEIMRSKSSAEKMISAFMAEPTTVMNMEIEAFVQAKRTGNWRQFIKSQSAIAMSIIANALLRAIAIAMRDDDDKERFSEKYLQAFWADIKSDVNPLNYFPITRDIMSILEGYNVDRMDMSVISDVSKTLLKTFDKAGKGTFTFDDFIDDLGSVALLFGVPLKNIIRDIRSVGNTVNTIKNAKYFSEADEMGLSLPYVYQKAYDKAWEKGESEEDCKKKGEAAARSEIKKALEDSYIEAYSNNDYEGMKEITSYMQQTGYYKNDVAKTVKSWVDKRDESEQKAKVAEERKKPKATEEK